MAGDDREFLDFFADEFWSLRRLGFLLTGDWGEAEELAQEAMARTFAAWSRVRHRQPAAYARKVLLNRHRSLLRRAVVEARHLVASRPQERHDPDFSGDDLVLWQALRRLPARQLGVPVGTVKSLVHRGLARLRDRLGAEYAGERLTSNTEAER